MIYPTLSLEAAVVQFLNTVGSVDALMSAVRDDPLIASSSSGVGLTRSRAEGILSARSRLPGGRFSSIPELAKVPGIGPDTLHDLLFSFQDPGGAVIEQSEVKPLSVAHIVKLRIVGTNLPEAPDGLLDAEGVAVPFEIRGQSRETVNGRTTLSCELYVGVGKAGSWVLTFSGSPGKPVSFLCEAAYVATRIPLLPKQQTFRFRHLAETLDRDGKPTPAVGVLAGIQQKDASESQVLYVVPCQKDDKPLFDLQLPPKESGPGSRFYADLCFARLDPTKGSFLVLTTARDLRPEERGRSADSDEADDFRSFKVEVRSYVDGANKLGTTTLPKVTVTANISVDGIASTQNPDIGSVLPVRRDEASGEEIVVVYPQTSFLLQAFIDNNKKKTVRISDVQATFLGRFPAGLKQTVPIPVSSAGDNAQRGMFAVGNVGTSAGKRSFVAFNKALVMAYNLTTGEEERYVQVVDPCSSAATLQPNNDVLNPRETRFKDGSPTNRALLNDPPRGTPEDPSIGPLPCSRLRERADLVNMLNAEAGDNQNKKVEINIAGRRYGQFAIANPQTSGSEQGSSPRAILVNGHSVPGLGIKVGSAEPIYTAYPALGSIPDQGYLKPIWAGGRTGFSGSETSNYRFFPSAYKKSGGKQNKVRFLFRGERKLHGGTPTYGILLGERDAQGKRAVYYQVNDAPFPSKTDNPNNTSPNVFFVDARDGSDYRHPANLAFSPKIPNAVSLGPLVSQRQKDVPFFADRFLVWGDIPQGNDPIRYDQGTLMVMKLTSTGFTTEARLPGLHPLLLSLDELQGTPENLGVSSANNALLPILATLRGPNGGSAVETLLTYVDSGVPASRLTFRPLRLDTFSALYPTDFELEEGARILTIAPIAEIPLIFDPARVEETTETVFVVEAPNPKVPGAKAITFRAIAKLRKEGRYALVEGTYVNPLPVP